MIFAISLFASVLLDCKNKENQPESYVEATFDPCKKFVTGIWVAPPPHLLETENDIRMRYQQLADAGINLVWGNVSGYNFSQREKIESMLNVCSELGLRFIVPLIIDRDNSDP